MACPDREIRRWKHLLETKKLSESWPVMKKRDTRKAGMQEEGTLTQGNDENSGLLGGRAIS